MLAFWQTYGYFNVFSNNVNKKMNKKALFLATDCTDYTDRRQKTPGRETEKPALPCCESGGWLPGINSGKLQGGWPRKGEYRISTARCPVENKEY
jgi:hypothetical protein